MVRWLGSPDVALDGRVRSWTNPEHPGFDYPEAAALWLSWVAWRRRSGQPSPGADVVEPVAERLTGLLDRDGAIGRDGAVYLFDTAVAVDALVGLGEARPDPWLPGLRRFLEAGTPVLPASRARWSERWGPHLLKAAALLTRAGHRAASVPSVALARQVRGRAAVGRCGYVHALAYGVEGELMLRSLGEPSGGLDPESVAMRLARLQRPDGGLPAWTDGSGPGRSDATAQAIRIWTAVDGCGFAARSRAAAAFLRRLQVEAGGVRYEPGSDDLNTWSTIFADQALDGAAPRRLI